MEKGICGHPICPNCTDKILFINDLLCTSREKIHDLQLELETIKKLYATR